MVQLLGVFPKLLFLSWRMGTSIFLVSKTLMKKCKQIKGSFLPIVRKSIFIVYNPIMDVSSPTNLLLKCFQVSSTFQGRQCLFLARWVWRFVMYLGVIHLFPICQLVGVFVFSQKIGVAWKFEESPRETEQSLKHLQICLVKSMFYGFYHGGFIPMKPPFWEI